MLTFCCFICCISVLSAANRVVEIIHRNGMRALAILFVTSAGDKSVSLLLEWHIKRCLKENKSPGLGMVMINQK